MNVKDQAADILERAITLEKRYYELLFSTLVTVFLAVIIVDSFNYEFEARVFPLVVAVPAFVIMLALLAVQLFPGAKAKINELSDSDVMAVEVDDVEIETSLEGSSAADITRVRYKLLVFFGWLALLYAALMLLGFVGGSLAFLLLFYRYQAEQDWLQAVVYSAAIWGFMLALFVFVLDTQMYEGVLVRFLLGV